MDELNAGTGNRYSLVCSNGECVVTVSVIFVISIKKYSFKVGEIVLPFVSGFFGQQIDMLEKLRPYDSANGPTEIDCRIYPFEIVQVRKHFVFDGIQSDMPLIG